MAFPTYPTIPDPWPDRAQGQATFDGAVSATFTFFGNLETWSVDWQTEAQGLAAALVAANLPSLTGRAENLIKVNSAEDGVSFFDARTGSNANGNWQYLGGKVLMWGDVTATFQDAARLSGGITWPVSVTGTPSGISLCEQTTGATLSITNANFLSGVRINNATDTDCSIVVTRDSAGGNFASGNNIKVFWSAIGVPA